MTLNQSVALAVAALLLGACAGTPSTYGTGVLPSHTIMKEGGIYKSAGYGISGDESEKSATFNANESCAVFKKSLWLAKWTLNIRAQWLKMSIKPLMP